MTYEPSTPESLSDLANREELRYREEIQAQAEPPEAFVRKIEASGRLQLLGHLQSMGIIEPAGEILEIGAGSGWLSAQLSLVPEVSLVTATDFSPRLVNEVMPFVARALGANDAKIVRKVADFHQLPFQRHTFDWVFADSALHHASNVVQLLTEVRRVLKPAGRLVAIREPVRPLMAAWQLRARREVVESLSVHGVAEPLFSRWQWDDFFSSAGFELTWHDVSFSRGVRRWFSLRMNGLVKADFCLVGRACA
jgi:SAM-dependent methyltransferase